MKIALSNWKEYHKILRSLQQRCGLCIYYDKENDRSPSHMHSEFFDMVWGFSNDDWLVGSSIAWWMCSSDNNLPSIIKFFKK